MVCAKMAMSAPARLAAITVGVAMGMISKLPLINAFEPIPDPMTVMTSASSPYFWNNLPSLVTKMMMLPMPTDGTPTRIFLSGLFCVSRADEREDQNHRANVKTDLKRTMESPRVKRLEHLEPLERQEPVKSHHLHIDIDQGRPFFRFDDLDRPFHRRANLIRFGDRTLAVKTEGARQVGKIHRRRGHFHTH